MIVTNQQVADEINQRIARGSLYQHNISEQFIEDVWITLKCKDKAWETKMFSGNRFALAPCRITEERADKIFELTNWQDAPISPAAKI
mgnify:CR=1 FL=1